MANLVGSSLGRYHILEQLGEGGMANVYKAFDTRLERNVAIKVILPSCEQNEKFLKRFEREARALAQLSHPNIVKVLDYGDQDGVPYLVMEYIPGGTLKQKLGLSFGHTRGNPVPWLEAVRLLVPIAHALEYAHHEKIIHRDIKPANILLTQSGEPMLSDFGIAKILESESTFDLTGTSAIIGTPEYMAPEQVLGEPTDHRVDIYALGVVFYEMVTGRSPYRADTPVAVMIKKTTDPLPRPGQFVPSLPETVEGVMLKALAKEPGNRYQDMGAFTRALEQISANPTPPPVPAAPPPVPAAPAARKSTWWPWALGGVALCLALVCIVGASLAGLPAVRNQLKTPTAAFTPTVLHIPTATQTPFTGTGGGTGNSLYADDFSNPESGWPIRYSGSDILDYSNGSYRIYVSGTMADLVANAGASLPADVIVEADITKAGGTDNNDFGVICRLKDLDNFYFFLISSDSYAVIGKFENNQMKYLSADAMQKVDGISAGTTTNHIRAECIGNAFKLYANGNLVAQTTDSTFTSGGDVGLMAGSFDQGGVDVLFDNIFVTRP